jgi:hypothetical protein
LEPPLETDPFGAIVVPLESCSSVTTLESLFTVEGVAICDVVDDVSIGAHPTAITNDKAGITKNELKEDFCI